jgi:hypothetical protein
MLELPNESLYVAWAPPAHRTHSFLWEAVARHPMIPPTAEMARAATTIATAMSFIPLDLLRSGLQFAIGVDGNWLEPLL